MYELAFRSDCSFVSDINSGASHTIACRDDAQQVTQRMSTCPLADINYAGKQVQEYRHVLACCLSDSQEGCH